MTPPAARAGGNTTEPAGETHAEAKLFGINPEAVGLVIAAVVGSVLLAIAIWRRPTGPVLIATAGFGLVFAAFDVREVVHQIDASRTDLVVIAGVLAGLHLGVAALAGALLVTRRERQALAPA